MLGLTEQEAAYIAGFLDGDGSIIIQIVRQQTYKYGYTVRVSITFFQKASRKWFLLWLHDKLGKRGCIRMRQDAMCEYNICAVNDVRVVLNRVLPYLCIKKGLCQLALSIIERKQLVKTKNDFLEVCKLVDKAVKYTDSKRRVITSTVVEAALCSNSFDSPVETLDVELVRNPG